MESRNLMVSILAVFALTLALTASVAAAELNVSSPVVYINGVEASGVTAVYPGDIISVRVYFTANEDIDDVTVEAEIEGYDGDISQKAYVGKVLSGKTYSKTLSLKVPYDLKDDESDSATLVVTVEGDDDEKVTEVALEVQRVPYDASIMSVNVPQTVEAGASVPVDVVIKNKGMEDLDDVYVKARISALGVERTAYFGDIVAFEDCDDDCDEKDTVSGRLFLQLPDNAKPGTYTVEVEVLNGDTSTSGVAQLVVQNEFSGSNVIVTESSKTVAVGEEAEYSLLIVNPSNKLKVYRIVPEASTDLTVKVSDAVIAVPAGSSKTVTLTTSSSTEGKYAVNVNILAGEELVQKVALTTEAKGSKTTNMANPIVILTIVLAVIFVVLLIVLITLLGKKPSKNEEFGESYY